MACPEQFQAAIRQDPLSVLALVSLAGGPGVVDADGSQQVTVYLKPGRYFLFCVVPDEQGVPHIAHGMIAPLEVVAAANEASEPQASIAVQMVDFAFALPADVKAGKQTWKVVAAGQQPHEMSLIKLAEGKTIADMQAWMHAPTGAPPFTNVGGLQAVNRGETAYLHLDLTPGTYVALCHVPDPASGKQHMELGMIVPFVVE
jgi:hypothetical protein